MLDENTRCLESWICSSICSTLAVCKNKIVAFQNKSQLSLGCPHDFLNGSVFIKMNSIHAHSSSVASTTRQVSAVVRR